MGINVDYLGTKYEVYFTQYLDGNTAILLEGLEALDSFMPATVNLGLIGASSDTVVIDVWDGLSKALQEAGLLGDYVGTRKSGFNEYEVYKLSSLAYKQLEENFKEKDLKVK